MGLEPLYPQTIQNLAQRAGSLLADCAVKDAAIADLRRQVARLEQELEERSEAGV